MDYCVANLAIDMDKRVILICCAVSLCLQCLYVFTDSDSGLPLLLSLCIRPWGCLDFQNDLVYNDCGTPIMKDERNTWNIITTRMLAQNKRQIQNHRMHYPVVWLISQMTQMSYNIFKHGNRWRKNVFLTAVHYGFRYNLTAIYIILLSRWTLRSWKRNINGFIDGTQIQGHEILARFGNS